MRNATILLATVAVLALCAQGLAQVDYTKEFAPDKDTVLLLRLNEGKGQPENAAGEKIKVKKMDAQWSKEGKFGGALSFKDGILAISDNPSLRFPKAMTVEMWIKPTEADCGKGYHILAHKRSKAGHKLYLVLKNGHLMNYPHIVGRSKLVPGAWYHVAYVVTGTKKDKGREYLFINGLLDADRPSQWEGVTDKAPLRIGGLSKKSEPFKGLIDEVRVSNIARPYPEVKK